MDFAAVPAPSFVSDLERSPTPAAPPVSRSLSLVRVGASEGCAVLVLAGREVGVAPRLAFGEEFAHGVAALRRVLLPFGLAVDDGLHEGSEHPFTEIVVLGSGEDVDRHGARLVRVRAGFRHAAEACLVRHAACLMDPYDAVAPVLDSLVSGQFAQIVVEIDGTAVDWALGFPERLAPPGVVHLDQPAPQLRVRGDRCPEKNSAVAVERSAS